MKTRGLLLRACLSKTKHADEFLCVFSRGAPGAQEEKNLLATKETAAIIVSKTLRLLHDSFIRRLLIEYAAAGLVGPRDLLASKDMSVSSVEHRVSALEKKSKEPNCECLIAYRLLKSTSYLHNQRATKRR